MRDEDALRDDLALHRENARLRADLLQAEMHVRCGRNNVEEAARLFASLDAGLIEPLEALRQLRVQFEVVARANVVTAERIFEKPPPLAGVV